ncbi:MAG: hypothetical protein ACLU62_07640 [Hydrogeniiclostridium sp.]
MDAYVYMGLWFVCGLLMIFRFGRENSIFYWLGAFFFFLGAWWLADILLPVNLFEGPWPWVLRGVSVCALAAAVWAYYREKKKTSSKEGTSGSDLQGRALPEQVAQDLEPSQNLPEASAETVVPQEGEEKTQREKNN